MRKAMRKRPTRSRGFTLVELGLVIGLIAVLTTVVLQMSGFIGSSKVGSAMQLTRTLRQAAQSWSKRNNGGAHFATINVAALQGANLVPNPLSGPLGHQSPPDAVPSIAAAGAGNTWVDITVCVEANQMADTKKYAEKVYGQLQVDPPTCPGACGAGNCEATVRTR